MDSRKGRSGVGFIGFGVLAIVLFAVVAAVAASVGHQMAIAEQVLAQVGG
jgi:hypothetical protein